MVVRAASEEGPCRWSTTAATRGAAIRKGLRISASLLADRENRRTEIPELYEEEDDGFGVDEAAARVEGYRTNRSIDAEEIGLAHVGALGAGLTNSIHDRGIGQEGGDPPAEQRAGKQFGEALGHRDDGVRPSDGNHRDRQGRQQACHPDRIVARCFWMCGRATCGGSWLPDRPTSGSAAQDRREFVVIGTKRNPSFAPHRSESSQEAGHPAS